MYYYMFVLLKRGFPHSPSTQAQQEAMDKALAARKQHLTEMRDRIRAKNDKIKKANTARLGSRPPTSDGRASSTQLPSLLGF